MTGTGTNERPGMRPDVDSMLDANGQAFNGNGIGKVRVRSRAGGKWPTQMRHRQVKYLNNVVEADHGKLELLIRPVREFKTLKAAYATIKGFEVMRALRKGQAGMFALQDGIVGEASIVERAFGIGSCALTEVMALPQDHLANAEA